MYRASCLLFRSRVLTASYVSGFTAALQHEQGRHVQKEEFVQKQKEREKIKEVQQQEYKQIQKEENKEKKEEKQVEKKDEWKREAQRELEALNISEIKKIIAVDASGSSRHLHLQSGFDRDYSFHKEFQTHWTYARTIDILGQVLEKEKGAEKFIAYAFGCKNHALEWICKQGKCPTFQTFLKQYKENGLDIGASYSWNGGTSSLGAVYEAAKTCMESRCYTILFILTDGEMRDDLSPIFQLIEKFLPMSIIFVRIHTYSGNEIAKYGVRFPTTVGDISYYQDKIQPEEFAKQLTQIISKHYSRVITKIVSRQQSMSVFNDIYEQIKREGA